MFCDSPWVERVRNRVFSLGGAHDGHVHIDRAFTWDQKNDHLPMGEKQKLISGLHESFFYEPVSLRERAAKYISTSYLSTQTSVYYLCIDIDDKIKTGAIDAIAEISQRYTGRFLFSAYAPTGCCQNLFEEVARRCDFICGLPETAGDFARHCEWLIGLGETLGKEVHLHLDQKNSQESNQVETVLDILSGASSHRVFAIHAISPSCYEEKRFGKMVDRMRSVDMGVVCCPSAAIGMSQNRNERAPIHNSIARVVDFYNAGLEVRLGTDNICDMFSPSTTPDLMIEIILASNAVRFYDVEAWARMACGLRHPKL